MECFCHCSEDVGPASCSFVQNSFASCLWTRNAPKPHVKSTTSIAEMRKRSQSAQMLRPDSPERNTVATAQEGSTQSTADPQANCEAPICLRCGAAGSSAWLFSALSRWLQSNIALSSLPLDGCISHSCCYRKGETTVLGESGRKVAIN